MKDDFLSYAMPFISVLASHDANCIINGTTIFFQSRWLQSGAKSPFWDVTSLMPV